MSVAIRSLQHFLYCPRRWGLTEIDRQWHDNAFIAYSELAHERVHTGTRVLSGENKIVRSGVWLYADEPDLVGIADCVEFTRGKPSAGATYIPSLGGSFRVAVVEYKPRMPAGGRIRDDDALQVYAQKLCADHVFGCDAEMTLYYTREKKRVAVPRERIAGLHELLLGTLARMARCMEERRIPALVRKDGCGGCSFADFCMPGVDGIDVRRAIGEKLRE